MVGYIVMALSFVSGILGGFTMKVQSYYRQDQFNFGLMIAVWVSGLLFLFICEIAGTIVEGLEILHSDSERLTKAILRKSSNDSKAVSVDDEITYLHTMPAVTDIWTCNYCNTPNNAENKECVRCHRPK